MIQCSGNRVNSVKGSACLLTFFSSSHCFHAHNVVNDEFEPSHGILHKNAGSTHDVEPITVALETGELSLEEKLARVPDAPDPVLLYSAYVT